MELKGYEREQNIYIEVEIKRANYNKISNELFKSLLPFNAHYGDINMFGYPKVYIFINDMNDLEQLHHIFKEHLNSYRDEIILQYEKGRLFQIIAYDGWRE